MQTLKNVKRRAINAFGYDEGMYLLWNETCYPMNAELASAQLDGVISATTKRAADDG